MTWTGKDLTVIMSLLLAGALWLGWNAGHPRIEFADQPPVQDHRVTAATDRIDPNTASAASMIRLGGIGPVLSAAIIKHRSSHDFKTFKTAGDLAVIHGIASGTIRRIAPDLSLPR